MITLFGSDLRTPNFEQDPMMYIPIYIVIEIIIWN